ncbi:MAG: FG-GAP repeat protein [Candidatus Diapherotrites archaeon]|nr:FG-GAP repeat protein [Candidatus Diapherotrites archaeon]
MRKGISQTVSIVLMITVAIVAVLGVYFFAVYILGPGENGKAPFYVSVEPIDPAKGRYLITNPSNDAITLDHLDTNDGVRCDFGKVVTIKPGGHAECVMPTKKCKFVIFGETSDGKGIAPMEVVISNCDSVPDIAFATSPALLSGTWVSGVDEFRNGTFYNTSVSGEGVQLYKKLNIPPLSHQSATLTGEAGSNSGFSLASGDFGSGKQEAAVGSPASDINGIDSGAVYVTEPTADASLQNARAVIKGNPGDFAGWSVATLAEPSSMLAVGAPTNDKNGYHSGAVYLFSSPVSGVLTPANAKATIYGSLCEQFGSSVANAGDVDGDGNDDLLVGSVVSSSISSKCSGSAPPKAYLFDGPISGDMTEGDATASFKILLAGFEFNYSVAGAGDVNGDGYDDVLIGVSAYDYGIGRAYLFYGPLSGSYNLNQANAIFVGDIRGGRAGYSVAGVDDVNGDNRSDIVIGAPGNQDIPGRVYLFYGPLNGTISLNNANATMIGMLPGDGFGSSVSRIGDADDDGFDDVLIGAPTSDYFGDVDSGMGYIFYGPLDGMYNLSDFEYKCSGSQFIGDVNGDDVVDFRDLMTLSRVIGLGLQPICFDPMELLSMTELSIGANGTGTGDQPICCGDVNNDGSVDFLDWLALKNYVMGVSTGFSRGYSCNVKENCFDSVDNDLDGQVDYDDNDCPSDAPERPYPSYAIFMGSPVASGAMVGTSTTSADFDGDGFSDALFGAPFGESNSGETLLMLGGPRKGYLPSGYFKSRKLSLDAEANFFNVSWYSDKQGVTLQLDNNGQWSTVENNTSPGFSSQNTTIKALLSTNSSLETPTLKEVDVSYRSPITTNLVYFVNYENGIKWVELKEDGKTILKEDVQKCYTFYAKTVKVDTSHSYEVTFQGCDGQMESKKLF